MTKKFVVFTSYGGNIPNVLLSFLKQTPFPQSRYSDDLISFIENNALELTEEEINAFNWEENPNAIVKFKPIKKPIEPDYESYDRYYSYHKCTDRFDGIDGVCGFAVVGFDTNKKWILQEYDGCESLCPLPEPVVRDPEINLYEYKRH